MPRDNGRLCVLGQRRSGTARGASLAACKNMATLPSGGWQCPCAGRHAQVLLSPQEHPLPSFWAARPLTRVKCQDDRHAGDVLGRIREERDDTQRVRMSQPDLRVLPKGARRSEEMRKNSRIWGISWDVQFSTLAKTPGGGAHLLLGWP